MANRLLEIVLKMTGDEGVRGGLNKLSTSLKNTGSRFKEFATNPLMLAGAFAGIVAGLRKAWEEGDNLSRSMQRLEGTAKIVNVPLAELQATAAKAREEFKLSTTAANNFASSAVTMAAKAGDVSKSGELMAAVLNLAAARGISADDALEALNITLKGQDEGLDKLVQKNPSAYYAEWAKNAGRTVGSLTDMEKKQAIVDGLIRDGGPVRDQYLQWLKTSEGQAFVTSQKTQEAWARVGQATQTVRNLTAGLVGWIADKVPQFVGGLQIIAAEAVKVFLGVPARFEVLWGKFMVAVANSIGESRVLLTIFGDKLTDIADQMGQSGTRMVREGSQHLNELQAQYDAKVARIVEIVERGQEQQTQAEDDGAGDRAGILSRAAQQREAAAKDALKAQADLHKQAADAQLALMTEMQREMLQLNETFHRAMQTQDKAAQEQAKRDYKTAWLAIHDSVIAVTPRVAEVRTELKGLTTDLSTGAPVVKETATNFWTVKDSVEGVADEVISAANAALTFTKGLGMTNPEIEKTVQNIGHLAEGIRGIAKSITADGVNVAGLMGGIAAGITGLQGIVGSIFGDSPAEAARKALLRENSDRLLALKNQIGDLMRSQTAGGKIARVQGAEGEIAALGSGSNDMPDRLARAANLMRILSARGLGKSDLDSILGDLNVSLGDWGKNGLSREQAAQLAEALRNWEPGRIEQDFTSQLDAIQRQFSIAGTDDPRAQLQAVLGVLAGPNGSQALASLIGGADLSSAEGVANLRAQLASWVGQARGGGLNPATLGGLNGSQFLAALEAVSGLLGRFGFDAASTSASFSAPAPDLGSVVGTVTDTFTAGSLGVIADAPVFAEIAANTARGAAAAEELVRLTRLSTGGASSAALDEALATTRDLYLASQGQG